MANVGCLLIENNPAAPTLTACEPPVIEAQTHIASLGEVLREQPGIKGLYSLVPRTGNYPRAFFATAVVVW